MSKGGKTTLNEIMGGHGEKASKQGLDLHDLPALLGEGMPKLEFHALGRVRLMRALRNRFGDGYRHLPGVSEAIKQFDHHAKVELEHHLIKKKWGKK